jgi:hypothetical protein
MNLIARWILAACHLEGCPAYQQRARSGAAMAYAAATGAVVLFGGLASDMKVEGRRSR